jgi:hypothetical protein
MLQVIGQWLFAIVALIALIAVVTIITWRGRWPVVWQASRGAWNAPNRVVKHAAVVAAVLLVILFLKSYAQSVAEQKASEWLTSYNGTATTDVVGRIDASVPGLLAETESATATATPTPVPAPSPTATPESTPIVSLPTEALTQQRSAPNATPTATPTPPPTEAEQKRMDAQLRTIRDRTKHHGDVMAFFYVNYFVAIVLVLCAGLLVALSLFFIAQGGWNGTNSYVRAIFIVASAVTAFYGLFPPVFEQQKNITDNKQLFLEYKSLESELESYNVTRATLKNEAKTPAEFINHLDAQMSRLGNIALGFDIGKITYDEVINLGKKPSPEPTATTLPPTNSRGQR